MINLLFCSDPFYPQAVEIDFEEEYRASKNAGFVNHLFSFEMLVKEKDARLALRKIKSIDTLQTIIYRGWMLKPGAYILLYNGLLLKNYRLINTVQEYKNSHYLPESYKFISGNTPATIWIKLADRQIDYDKVFNAVEKFGTSPLIIKDYVKSQKHYWDTACFISNAADKDKVKSVINRFIELQGDDLNEGIVIREFIPLNDLTVHSKSGMPLKEEYRLFFLNKQLLGCYDYWEEGEYSNMEKPPLDFFEKIAMGIESKFFSMDIAKTAAGNWTIIELGDGQVTGFPDRANKNQFYHQIFNLLGL